MISILQYLQQGSNPPPFKLRRRKVCAKSPYYCHGEIQCIASPSKLQPRPYCCRGGRIMHRPQPSLLAAKLARDSYLRCELGV